MRASLRLANKGPALERVAARARETGFELLALRAEMLAEGAGSAQARAELGRRGVAVDDPAVLDNIDTPEDLARLRARDPPER